MAYGTDTDIYEAKETATVLGTPNRAMVRVMDALGRLRRVQEDPGGLNYVTNYGYDAMGRLLLVSQDGWNAANPDDIPLVVGSIVRKFEEIGLLSFSTYSDTETVYRILASNDPEDHVHSPILGARCVLGDCCRPPAKSKQRIGGTKP